MRTAASRPPTPTPRWPRRWARRWGSSGRSATQLDVVVATAAANAVQGQLLTGNGTGAFTASTPPTNTSTGPSGIAPNLWSNILSGDFNGDGKPDLAYSLTGNPLPAPGTGSGLYVQYGNGDGTFQTAGGRHPVGSASNNTSTARARWASSTRAATPASPISMQTTTTRCSGRVRTRSTSD